MMQGREEVRARLDWVLFTDGWLDCFLDSVVQHLVANTSDRVPIKLQLKGRRKRASRGKRGFRFEPMWLREEECRRIVEEAWRRGDVEDGNLRDRLEHCRRDLIAWSHEKFGDVKVKFDNLKAELERIITLKRTPEFVEEQKRINMELDEWYERDELYQIG